MDHVLHYMVIDADIPFLTIMRTGTCSAVVTTMCVLDDTRLAECKGVLLRAM
jgi:hypothetical protein